MNPANQDLITSRSYFISTGEPSGDLLAAELVAALKILDPGMQAHGVVGPKLRAQKVVEVAGIEALSVMGFAEVLKQFVGILKLENLLIAYIERLRPRFVILVDYPGFHLHLAERLRDLNVPIYQFVAPQLWAWGEKRVERLKRVTDAVFGIMPFEQDWFVSRGVNFHYVGTPQVDRARIAATGRHQGLPQGPMIGLFPGSRRSEVARILPTLLETSEVILKRNPEVFVAISIAESIDPQWLKESVFKSQDFKSNLLNAVGNTVRLRDRLYLARGDALSLMKQAKSACVTSGTATLECALCETPMTVIYKTSTITYELGKRLVKLPHISLVNLVDGQGFVREFVQHFNVEDLANDLLNLAVDPALRSAALDRLKQLHSKLKGNPGTNTAALIMSLTNQPPTAVRSFDTPV